MPYGIIEVGDKKILGNLEVSECVTAKQLKSVVATGTAPLVVESTTPVANLNVHASAVNLLRVGTATYDDVQDFVNTLFSAGRISGGDITDAGSGQVNIAAGTGMIKVSDAELTEVRFCDWSAVSGQALADNVLNHIYVRYNAASPDVQVTTDESTINGHDEFELGQVYRSGTDIHIAEHGPDLVDHLFHITERFHDSGHLRANGLIISHTGTRNIAMTAGAFWVELSYVTLSALDTSDSDTFTAHYHSSGSWTSAAAQTQINNTQYDDGSDLATLTANRYGVHWVFVHEEGDMHIVYGQGDYKLAEAEGSTVPAGLPDIVTEMGSLIGRIIVQKNGASFVEVATAFDTTFGFTGVSDHAELANLQGGTADEYYHLTAAEETELTEWLASVILAANGDTTVADLTADNVICAGDVDGRDVSDDGDKLDALDGWVDDHVADTGAHHAEDHAGRHVDENDPIQDATAGQKGVATADQITKLDAIEALADVTDATNVNAAGAVMESDSIDVVSDMDTTTVPPSLSDVFKWNGSKWVPAAYDYEFAFSIATFSDGISDTTQLIGSGTWKAIGAITFTATYNNAPDGMTAEVAMSGANNAWDDPLAMAPVTGPEDSTEIVEYPAATGGTVTFTLSQDADETTDVESVTFDNAMRYGNSVLAQGNQTEGSLEALTEVAGPWESPPGTISNIPTTANYLVFAYADRITPIAQIRRNHDGLGYVTASFDADRTVVAPDEQAGVANVENSAGYSETFACVTSTDTGLADNTDDFQLMTGGTPQNYIRMGGITKSGSYNESDIESGLTDPYQEATNDQTQIWSTVTLEASEYFVFAMPSRLSTPTFWDYDTGFAAAFEEPETVAITNDAGFRENYKVFRSTNILGPGDFTLETK